MTIHFWILEVSVILISNQPRGPDQNGLLVDSSTALCLVGYRWILDLSKRGEDFNLVDFEWQAMCNIPCSAQEMFKV